MIKMSENVIYKRVDDSRTETAHLIRPVHLNGANRLFGGTLMQWIDEVAAVLPDRFPMTIMIIALPFPNV